MAKSEFCNIILMADDDEDDCMIAGLALRESRISDKLRTVVDGKELMDYLYWQGSFTETERFPRPNLILLDLNMPRKDGREALREIKSDPELKSIPIVILTTSSEERDVDFCERVGAASFITKPADFKEWVKIMESLVAYLPDEST